MNKYMMHATWADGHWHQYFIIEAELEIEAIMIFAQDAYVNGEVYTAVRAELVQP